MRLIARHYSVEYGHRIRLIDNYRVARCFLQANIHKVNQTESGITTISASHHHRQNVPNNKVLLEQFIPTNRRFFLRLPITPDFASLRCSHHQQQQSNNHNTSSNMRHNHSCRISRTAANQIAKFVWRCRAAYKSPSRFRSINPRAVAPRNLVFHFSVSHHKKL